MTKFMEEDIDKRFKHEQPRIRFAIVPQKSDPSKIFLVALGDHSVMDGGSVIHTFS